ncbi:ferritin-like domain-containing protein [Arcobacter sp. FWKO B]|uniref:ferritin-like domain-containing protein n=1 Tax=Arcobacter sp. FWKO B TaxID=2593672 RepID=UPI0018A5A2FD|nr:ferritin-like domain-containing protein [Arcobacter sp. FWKO B]QOG11562.1 ferritin-like domain-containing protein [Arcobacter sp. FWKO B]
MLFYSQIYDILITANPNEKIEKFKIFYNNFLSNDISFDNDCSIKNLLEPSYSSICKVVLPKEQRKRKYLDTLDGKKNLLHTIAHIEYSAIDLALDACYRFRNMPLEYYKDWLEVAEDEVRHYEMLSSLMGEVGVKYGDFPVHTNLFVAMNKTQNLLDRMAVVPRYLEANGLEQNPKIMIKLKSNPDEFNLKIISALEIILDEEIDHVRKGDRWFKYECDRLHLEPKQTYLDILERYYPGSTQKVQELNFEARKEAGFSCDELKILSKKGDCK